MMNMIGAARRLGNILTDLGEQFSDHHQQLLHSAGNSPNEPTIAATPQQQRPTVRNRVPPASVTSLQKLPIVTVRAQDLIDPTNRHCCICLDTIQIKSSVLRLPCAHLFHPTCGREWLRRKCSCPVCRFELPTDDANFERGRVQRMKSRKPRYARYELERLSVLELMELARSKTLPAHILDKVELVEYLIASHAIDLIPTDDNDDTIVRYRLSDLQKMSVRELKGVMNDAGVFYDALEVVEKQDMIDIFSLSGRWHILLEEEQAAEEMIVEKYKTEDEIQNTALMAVETVYSDSEEEIGHNDEEQDIEATTSARVHTNLVMEDNLTFAKHQADFERADTEPSECLITTESKRLPATTHSSVSRHSKKAFVPTIVSSDSLHPSRATSETELAADEAGQITKPKIAPAQGMNELIAALSQTTSNSATIDALCAHFEDVALSLVKAAATELDVDISDLLAERSRLDRRMMTRLINASTSQTEATANQSATWKEAHDTTEHHYGSKQC